MGDREGARSGGLDLLKIVQDALNNDRAALEKLIVWIIRRLKYAGVRNVEDRKEVCGDVLLEIHVHFTGALPCAADMTDRYIARMVSNKVKDFWRRKATGKRHGEVLTGEIPDHEPQTSEPQALMLDEEIDIRDWIAGLPQCERCAIQGYMLWESAEQTAARTGISLGTLKDCRKRVRKLFQERFPRKG